MPPRPDDDVTLLAQIEKGDPAAFAALVKRHAERSYRIAYRFVQSRAEAEDMVQDAFITVWERPGLWRPERGASFATWFTRIVINRCLDARKKKRPLPLEAAQHVAAKDLPQDEQLMRARRHQQLEAEIATLPQRQRTALNLCFNEELSNREAADIMQIPLKALQSLLMRAKATLIDRLREK